MVQDVITRGINTKGDTRMRKKVGESDGIKGRDRQKPCIKANSFLEKTSLSNYCYRQSPTTTRQEIQILLF